MAASSPRLLRRRIPVGAVVGAGLALVMACTNSDHDEDDTQFRRDVIYCEEAVARLEKCCGASFIASKVECRHFYSKDTGCGQTSIDKVDPALTLPESICIQDTSCEVIIQTKVCDRAAAAGGARITQYKSDNTTFSSSSSTTSTTSGSAATGPVCP